MYNDRITVMPVISAAGTAGPPLFVLKWKRIPYRTWLRNGRIVYETPASRLPHKAVVAFRAELGGVDSDNFANWARVFVESIHDLLKEGRKVLVVYDGYRWHLSLRVLEFFHDRNVVLYALPADTSGKTQPLDCVVFGASKRKLNNVFINIGIGSHTELDVFDICSIIREAYHDTFTSGNIKAAFSRSGICPLDMHRLLFVPRPRSPTDSTEIIGCEQLEELFIEKQAELRNAVLGESATLKPHGYVDTSLGKVMTSSIVLSLVKAGANRRKAARNSVNISARKKGLEEARKLRAKRKRAELFSEYVCTRRATLCSETVADYRKRVRLLQVRRAAARYRTASARGQQQ